MNELSKESRDVIKEIMNVVFGSIGLITILFFAFVFFNLAQLIVSQFQIFEPNTYILKINGGSTTQLNPFDAATSIFTGLTIILLGLAFWQQQEALKTAKEDLKITREELKKSQDIFEDQKIALKIQNDATRKQSIESTFFGMLSMLEERATQFEYNNGGKIFKGRPALEKLFPFSEILNHSKVADKDESFNAVIEIYREFLNKNSGQVGSYFFLIAEIMLFLGQFEKDKVLVLFRIVRARLSPVEATALGFLCIRNSTYANFANDPLKNILEDYHLLYNVLPDSEVFRHLTDRLKPSAFGIKHK